MVWPISVSWLLIQKYFLMPAKITFFAKYGYVCVKYYFIASLPTICSGKLLYTDQEGIP
jgi:hypothetical protein